MVNFGPQRNTLSLRPSAVLSLFKWCKPYLVLDPGRNILSFCLSNRLSFLQWHGPHLTDPISIDALYPAFHAILYLTSKN